MQKKKKKESAGRKERTRPFIIVGEKNSIKAEDTEVVDKDTGTG